MIGVGISAGLSGAKRARSIQDPLPALDLDWATDRSMPAAYGPTPSFSRASTGTYFTSSGVLTTAAINGPRFNHVYNGSSWVSKGLLIEEQRTNTATYSEDFSNGSWIKTTATISANSSTTPDGTTTADLCYPTSTGTFRGFYKSFSSASVATTIFAKSAGKTTFAFIASDGNSVGASFNLSNGTVSNVFSGHTATITPVGDGWYRCSLSATTTVLQVFIQDSQGTSATVTANSTDGILFWGAQIEAGSFPTSYIPTTTAAVTRSADVCQITGGDFSGFWNSSEGSYAIEFDRLADHNAGNTNRWTLSLTNGSTSYIDHFAATPGGGSYNDYSVIYSTGSQQAAAFVTSLAGGVMAKSATGWKVNDFAASFNGGAVQTDSSVIVPVGINRLDLGMSGSNYFLCGHISRLRYYPTRLTNAKLQELST
jgi:hypothetical protein